MSPLSNQEEKSTEAKVDSFGYSLVKDITRIGVILFALFQCLVLDTCCKPRPSITTSRKPLWSLKDKGEYSPCIIENKKIYHYVQEEGFGTLESYHDFKEIKDKGVFLYEDLNSSVQLPLMSYFKPYVGWQWNSDVFLRFFIYEKENEYVVYYYGDSPDVEAKHISVENIVVENNPFSKKLVVKELDHSHINDLYLKDALCKGVH